MVSKFFTASLLWEGEVCMNDTDHCVRHRDVHQSNCVSIRDEKKLSIAERSIWTRPGTVLGWSDPTFAHDSVAKGCLGSLQPTRFLSMFCPHASPDSRRKKGRKKVTKVKTVGITLCTFRIANFFTRCSAFAIRPLSLATTTSSRVTAQKGQIGRERPHFFADVPPKSFLGSLPPSQALRVDELLCLDGASPRVCQTECLTFCRNGKGETLCPF